MKWSCLFWIIGPAQTTSSFITWFTGNSSKKQRHSENFKNTCTDANTTICTTRNKDDNGALLAHFKQRVRIGVSDCWFINLTFDWKTYLLCVYTTGYSAPSYNCLRHAKYIDIPPMQIHIHLANLLIVTHPVNWILPNLNVIHACYKHVMLDQQWGMAWTVHKHTYMV